MYQLEIGVPSYMCKTTISGDFNTDEDFLNYVYEELRIKNYKLRIRKLIDKDKIIINIVEFSFTLIKNFINFTIF